jgi:ADP-ribosyl-[dinitrogen reductase] hydrolase
MTVPIQVSSSVVGSLLGTAVGDALGLPYENLSRRRGVQLLGEPSRHRFLFGRGMVSDDTEHSCMVAQALIASSADPDAFARSLAWRFRWWLLTMPAGVGWATLRAILKLWCGFSPLRSGVFSAGNGPAMRSAILGAAVDDLDRLIPLVSATTRITHTDPKAGYGALAVALAARHARRNPLPRGDVFLEELRSALPPGAQTEFLPLIESAIASAVAGDSTTAYTESRGWKKGVSGYVYRTVPAVLHAWLRHPQDFRAAVTAVIRCGGDTDSTAAIVGGIVGAGVGKDGIPAEWLDRLLEWPGTVTWMERLALQLDQTLINGEMGTPLRLPILGLLLRNAFFFTVVVGHILRRLLPPY